MDAKQLPARPNLEQFRKQAKDLLKERKSSKATQRIKRFHPRLRQLTEAQIAATKFSLADAQWVIAQEHAFESWPKFAKHVQEIARTDSPISKFEMAADAIVSGDLKTLKRVLRENPELAHARSTRLHRAPLIHYVAANGIEDFRQKTPKNIVQITQALLNAGAEVDATTMAYGSASTALGLAATSYHPAKAGFQLDLLDVLLKAGACINGAPGGWNTVVAALHNGRGEAASFLAGRGANLDLESAAGTGQVDTIAHYIAEDGTLRAGATRKQLNYGFLWACEYGHTPAVRFLLDRGFRPDANLLQRETGLHWAAFGGHAEIVDLLLRTNAPVNVQDERFDGTPLGWAIYGWSNPAPESKNARYYDVVELLVRAGAIVDRKWLGSPNRGTSLGAKLRADPRMLAALHVED
ncbi:MAG TPA: ankyrin repeat domain-containing protein [Pyrinomonadaceae bacterium]|nr:ankyrin repeat domain-containing protein [Pyrinomonadaceae bacterium]